MKNHQSNDYSVEETVRRRDEVIKRMLNTPPQPRRAKREQEAKEKPARKARSKSPS
jgi:hypothetical protein